MINSSKNIKTSGYVERCSKCNKKNHILINCPCDKKFCLECRFPDLHACPFDFKARTQEYLKKNNPQVIKEKVPNKL
jgi:predicted nucleic acid binding AN1-type Zn finger protein